MALALPASEQEQPGDAAAAPLPEPVFQPGGGCRVLSADSSTSVATVGTAICVFQGCAGACARARLARPLAHVLDCSSVPEAIFFASMQVSSDGLVVGLLGSHRWTSRYVGGLPRGPVKGETCVVYGHCRCANGACQGHATH